MSAQTDREQQSPAPPQTAAPAPPLPNSSGAGLTAALAQPGLAPAPADTQRWPDSTLRLPSAGQAPAPSPPAVDSTTTGLVPFISIIVPVRNEERFIRATVAQLLSQDYPAERFEILVIDGRSTDRTPTIVEQLASEHPNVHLLDNPRRLSSAARNVGIRHARGEMILLVDGHCEIPSRQMLRHVAQAFAETGADCLGRPQPLDVANATPLQRAIAAARSSWLGHHPDSFIYADQPRFVPAKSVAVAYRRAVFDRVGLFDERFDACEDVELNHRIDRAGLRCYFTPQIAVRYFPRETLGGLFRQLVRYGRGRVRLMRKHPETRSLRTLLPAVLVVFIFLGWVPAICIPYAALAYLSALLVYTTCVLATSLWLAISSVRIAYVWLVPVALAVIHVSTGAGLLCELVSKTRGAQSACRSRGDWR